MSQKKQLQWPWSVLNRLLLTSIYFTTFYLVFSTSFDLYAVEKVFSLSSNLPLVWLVTTKIAARLKHAGQLRGLSRLLEIATVVLKKNLIGVLDTDEIKPNVSQKHFKYPLFTSIFERFAIKIANDKTKKKKK